MISIKTLVIDDDEEEDGGDDDVADCDFDYTSRC